MSANDLINAVRRIIPNATLGQDNDGQIIIYTNMTYDENDSLIDMDDQESDDA